MSDQPNVLVVSAHAADFVWRCGGAMAIYARDGARVHVVCVTSGERGESTALWDNAQGTAEEMSEEKAIAIRKAESIRAGEILGAGMEFLDLSDHPLEYGRPEILRLAEIVRHFRPSIVLTHHAQDLLNPDHVAVFELVRWAVRAASVAGVLPESARIPVPRLYSFEPDEAALDEFSPDIYVDITDVQEVKRRAMDSVTTQAHEMAQRYTDRAAFRASLAARYAPAPMQYAEGFVQHLPFVGKRFPV